MKKLFILTIILMSCTTAVWATITHITFEPLPIPLTLDDGGGHEAIWQDIDTLLNKGLRKQAMQAVDSVYALVKKENDLATQVKCVIYHVKCLDLVEPKGQVLAKDWLNAEIKQASSPFKELLLSIEADIYRMYLIWSVPALNYDQLGDKTPQSMDLEVWNAPHIREKIVGFYESSLANKATQQYRLADFKGIFNDEGALMDLPNASLYDFLVWRYLDYLGDYNNDPNSYMGAWSIDEDKVLGTTNEFLRSKPFFYDSVSYSYKTFKLFQELSSLHQSDTNQAMMQTIDMHRIKFIHYALNGSQQDAVYVALIKREMKRHLHESIYAEWAYLLASYYYNLNARYYQNDAPAHKWDLKTAYEIADAACSKFPNSIGTKQCNNLKAVISNPRLSMEAENVYPLNTPILMLMNYQNTLIVYHRLVYLEEEEYPLGANDYSSRYPSYPVDRLKLIADTLSKLPAVKEWAVAPSHDGDFRVHHAEIKVAPQSKAGRYVLISSINPKFDKPDGQETYTSFYISNILYEGGFDTTCLALNLLDRLSGESLSNVKGVLYSQPATDSLGYCHKPKVLDTYVSNHKGEMPVCSYTPYEMHYNNTSHPTSLKLSKGNDYLIQSNTDVQGGAGPNRNDTFIDVVFYLDRAIYRPGQTVHYKGLVLKRDAYYHYGEALAYNNRHISVLDANRQELYHFNMTTNENGSFSGEFVLPTTGLLGLMRIRDDDSYYNYMGDYYSFRVEEYKRPKFDVVINPITSTYSIGDTITVKGKALSFAGSPIDKSNVTYRVACVITYPYKSQLDMYNVRPEVTRVTDGTVQTDEKGEFEFKFKTEDSPMASKNEIPVFVYQINAWITDGFGETQRAFRSVKVAHVSTIADVVVEPIQNRVTLKEFKLSSFNVNGAFEPINGTLTIERLNEPEQTYRKRLWRETNIDQRIMNSAEFKESFPTMAYKNEDDITTWSVNSVVLQRDFDTKQDKAISISKLDDFKAGSYKLTLMAKDKYGMPLSIVKYMAVYDVKRQCMPANTPLMLQPDKLSYEPGEKAIIYIGSSFKHCYVNYTIEHESRIVEKGQIDIHGIAELSIPILEKYRGNIIIHVLMVKDSRVYKINEVINVPFSNKELKIEYTSFRDKLAPGQEEEWRLKILGPKGDKLSSELLASLYDASLDKLVNHSWESKFFRNTKAASHWSELLNNYGISKSYGLQAFNSVRLGVNSRAYPSLNWYDLLSVFRARYSLMYADDESFLGASRTYYNRRNQGGYGLYLSAEQIAKRGTRDLSTVGLSGAKISLEDESRGMASSGLSLGDMAIMNLNMKETSPDIIGFDEVKIRTNLDETVFFMPELRTDAEGNVVIKFKMNEALTRWKLMLLAHTKDLETAYAERYIVTQKPLMIVPNAPRFLRVNDEIVFTAKVNNLSATALTGEAKLELYDALTMQPIDSLLRNMQAILPFTVAQGQSAILQWPLKIPSTIGAVTYRVIAKSDNFSDGEENTLPVVTNQILVTEATPLPIRGGEHRTFELKHFEEIFQSKTMRPHKLTLEFTSNPSWYAIQSLTYLMEYPHECTEQLFSRYYANSIAAYVMNKHPKIKQVFETWKSEQSNALISNWEKNPELKLALIEETPWVLEAKNDTERKRNISLLFDFSRMSNELDNALDKMAKHQNGNGAFGWFSNQYINDYMTQYVIEGFGHLNQLGVNVFGDNSRANTIVRQAIAYCDNRFLATYNDSSSRKPFNPTVLGYNIDWVSIHYLYVRSFYLNATEGHLYVPIESDLKKAYDYYMKQVARFGHLEGSLYARGLMALAAYRYGEVDVAKTLVKSIRDIATINDDFGMHWNSKYGYYWYNMNIETHALLLEMFNEVTHDSVAIEGIKMYLLRAKQVLAWETTKATTAATYALLLTGDDWLEEDENLKITVGNTVVDQSKLEKEVGTGYFKTSWNTTAVKPEMSNISIENPNKHVAWGAIYWQYFEDLEKVKTFKETPLRLEKRLSHLVKNQNGSHYEPVTDTTVLHIGELINVELELNVEHPMEYIHLKDMRAACFEPTSVLSETKYQNWITYYESTRDLSTNFFIDYLIEGKYIFTYSLYVTHSGNFSNGIGMAQSMYAPEFTSHSAGMRIQVK